MKGLEDILNRVSMVYIKIIQDKHDDVKISLKCMLGETEDFTVKMLRNF